MQQSETEISKDIAAFLDKAGIYNLRLQSGRLRKRGAFVNLCKPGTPDRFFMMPRFGRAFSVPVFCEVKRTGETPSAGQKLAHDEIVRKGGVVIVADSLDAFIRQFDELKKQCS